MTITMDWGTRVINIPRADMTIIQVSPEIRELDLEAFRLILRDLEEDENGITEPITHNHVTTKTISGVTLGRVIEIINGYTVTFEDGLYQVNAVGANSNLLDVKNVNSVSLATQNSAGLQVVVQGSGVLPADITAIAAEVWETLLSNHMNDGTAGLVVQEIAGLAKKNQKIYDTVHVNGRLTEAKIKIYPTAADQAADTNAIATYQTTTTYNVEGKMLTYEQVVLP